MWQLSPRDDVHIRLTAQIICFVWNVTLLNHVFSQHDEKMLMNVCKMLIWCCSETNYSDMKACVCVQTLHTNILFLFETEKSLQCFLWTESHWETVCRIWTIMCFSAFRNKRNGWQICNQIRCEQRLL